MLTFAIIHKTSLEVTNIVVADSLQDCEVMFPDNKIIQVPNEKQIKDESLSPEQYLPHIGLKYDEKTGFEQPIITENIINDHLKAIYNNKPSDDPNLVWFKNSWIRFSDEELSEYKKNISIKIDKTDFQIPN